MRAGSGAVIVQSAPGAAATMPRGGDDAFERRGASVMRRHRRGRLGLDFLDRRLAASGHAERSADHENSLILAVIAVALPSARSRSASASW